MGVCIYDRTNRRKSPFGVKWSVDGKRKFKFFASKKDRDAFKAALEKQAAAQGRTILSMSAADAVIWRECLQKAGSPAAVLRAVDRFASAARVQDLRIEKARREYVDEKINSGLDDEYIRKLTGVLKKLPGGAVSAAFTPEDARRWVAGLRLAPRTVCGHVRDAVGFWNWMVRRGYASENVFSTVPLPKLVESEPGFLTVEQTKALFKAAQADYPDAVAYLALGAFAGLRSSAAVRIGREHIRFEQRGILITGQHAKNSRRQFVDGHEPNLWAWLEWARAHAPAGFELEARLWERRRGQVAEKAKVIMPHNALRHSFCTYHCALYGDAGKTATLLTHRGNVAILYQHYKGNAGRPDAEKYFGIRPG